MMMLMTAAAYNVKGQCKDAENKISSRMTKWKAKRIAKTKRK
jgi:hypothetical protein